MFVNLCPFFFVAKLSKPQCHFCWFGSSCGRLRRNYQRYGDDGQTGSARPFQSRIHRHQKLVGACAKGFWGTEIRHDLEYRSRRPFLSPQSLLGCARLSVVCGIAVSSSSASPHFALVPLPGILFWKKRAEEEVQRSGIPYTIIRPGGLKSEGPELPIVSRPGGHFGLPPRAAPSGPILRSQARRWAPARRRLAPASRPFANPIARF